LTLLDGRRFKQPAVSTSAQLDFLHQVDPCEATTSDQTITTDIATIKHRWLAQ
jgi:hypothetical protein